MADSRWHPRICWGVIIAACIVGKVALAFIGDSPAPRSAASHALQVATTSALAVLLLVVLASRRLRVRLRIRPRLSRPAVHGDAYLEAFTLKTLLTVAAWAALAFVDAGWFIDWGWSAWFAAACDRLPFLVAMGYACVRAHSVRVPLAEWGWRRGQGGVRELSIGIGAGIVAWSARHFSRTLAEPDAIGTFLVVGTVLFTPVLEETLYRGMLYRHLRNRLRWLPAALITATVFALFHSTSNMPNAYVGGLLYALLREWRGSLIAPVAAHASMNLLSVAASGWLI